MANRFQNPMHERPNAGPARKKPTMAKDPGFREKPSFNTGVPGKTQPKDRSNGIKRVPVYPDSEGL